MTVGRPPPLYRRDSRLHGNDGRGGRHPHPLILNLLKDGKIKFFELPPKPLAIPQTLG